MAIPDPDTDRARSEIINSGSFGDALAVGGVLVLLAWPVARVLMGLRRLFRRTGGV